MNHHNQQWIRDCSLVLFSGREEGAKALDLSKMRIRFQTQQFDEETPNTCAIRVYNLSKTTEKLVRSEYASVLLKAGYENGTSGVIFNGTIRQFRMGRESNLDSFLDLLCADEDTWYNFGVSVGSDAAGTPMSEVLRRAAKESTNPMSIDPTYPTSLNGTELIRGKVRMAMGRDIVRDISNSVNASWSIQNGKLQMIELTGYLPGEAVILNSFSGLIGIPELTEEGIRCRALLNPNFRVGGLVKLNNEEVNKIVQQNPSDPRTYNSWKSFQHLANLSADGLYRLYVVEHNGDTRGNEWYSDMVCLAVNSGQVAPFGIVSERNF